MLDHVRSHARHPFVYPMVCVAAHTGARRSEILRLQIHDIDFASDSILLNEKKRAKGKRTTRRVPLSPTLKRVLQDWIAQHAGGASLFGYAAPMARSKKKRTEPTAITHDEAHDHFHRTLADSKWDKLKGWHVLRHSFASNCAARRVDQRLIDQWMGHQTEEMRKRYRHLVPSDEQQALATVFGG